MTDLLGVQSAPDFKSVLVTRLTRYYTRLGSETISLDFRSLAEVQLKTAQEALAVLSRIQRILQRDAPPGAPPLLGTRDLTQIRTLLSIVFNWGVNYLLAKVMIAFASTPPIPGQRVIDLTATPDDYGLLKSMISDIIHLLCNRGVKADASQSLIITTVLDRHATDLLKGCLTLGWLPRSLSSDGIDALDAARPFTTSTLNLLPSSQAITTLGTIMSQTPLLQHVRKSCAFFLSQQLLRPQGVRGLCAAMFGKGAAVDEDASMEKLDHIARVLTTVPATMKPEEYFNTIIPRIIDMLSPGDPSPYKRAASYTISRVLSAGNSFPYQALATKITFSILHHPFVFPKERSIPGADPPDPPPPDPSDVLPKLMTLVSNADPSPTLISTLLSPLATSLYSLLLCANKVKTCDPTLRQSLRGLLVTWGKIVDLPEGIDILWSLLDNEEGSWNIDADGFRRCREPGHNAPLSLPTPQDLQFENTDFDINILDLYPNPNHFVEFLKDVDRPEISSNLFLKLLEACQHQKARGAEGNPVKTLLYLQIIIQMQAKMSHGSNILYKPAHLLSFIKHTLEPITRPNIHEQAEWDAISDEVDSDDDTSGAVFNASDEEMTETSLNLLLSVLEANEDLSARTEPILNEIFALLGPLARERFPAIGPLAQEARMVMTARLASTSTTTGSGAKGEAESGLVTYQKALKLLQDPILPVRAHGLLLLRQLVTPTSSKAAERNLDSALVPAILDIFLQSVQEDDSYIFSNAVKGLAFMVDAFGKDVLKSLVKEYADGLEGLAATSLTQRELDIRLRVGEALASAIRRCGAALGKYVDIIVPPLRYILRSVDIPIVLRTSSISLLTECEETNPLAMLPYLTDLVNTMIDLLQIEMAPARSRNSVPAENGKITNLDSEPTSKDPKVPAFRRAAAQFLLFVVRQTTKQVYESSLQTSPLPMGLFKRATVTLSYIASTDEDSIVQKIAREACEQLAQLQEAFMET